MRALPPALLLTLALVVAGCDRQPSQAPSPEAPTPTVAATVAAPAAMTAIVPPASTSVAPATPVAAASPSPSRDPAEVLAGWARAVEARDWMLVRAYWGEHGTESGLSPAEFAARWNRLRAPKVTPGPAEAEGAAGSSFYDAPVMIADGPRRLAGQVVLRRVNDVDGASPEQLRWHIQSSTLAP